MLTKEDLRVGELYETGDRNFKIGDRFIKKEDRTTLTIVEVIESSLGSKFALLEKDDAEPNPEVDAIAKEVMLNALRIEGDFLGEVYKYGVFELDWEGNLPESFYSCYEPLSEIVVQEVVKQEEEELDCPSFDWERKELVEEDSNTCVAEESIKQEDEQKMEAKIGEVYRRGNSEVNYRVAGIEKDIYGNKYVIYEREGFTSGYNKEQLLGKGSNFPFKVIDGDKYKDEHFYRFDFEESFLNRFTLIEDGAKVLSKEARNLAIEEAKKIIGERLWNDDSGFGEVRVLDVRKDRIRVGVVYDDREEEKQGNEQYYEKAIIYNYKEVVEMINDYKNKMGILDGDSVFKLKDGSVYFRTKEVYLGEDCEVEHIRKVTCYREAELTNDNTGFTVKRPKNRMDGARFYGLWRDIEVVEVYKYDKIAIDGIYQISKVWEKGKYWERELEIGETFFTLVFGQGEEIIKEVEYTGEGYSKSIVESGMYFEEREEVEEYLEKIIEIRDASRK